MRCSKEFVAVQNQGLSENEKARRSGPSRVVPAQAGIQFAPQLVFSPFSLKYRSAPGWKGIGEAPVIAGAAAIANAVAAATGVRLRDLPMHRQRAWRAFNT